MEKQKGEWVTQCTAVDEGCSKTHFGVLGKKGPPKSYTSSSRPTTPVFCEVKITVFVQKEFYGFEESIDKCSRSQSQGDI